MNTKTEKLLDEIFEHFETAYNFINEKRTRFFLPNYAIERDEKNNLMVYVELPGLAKEDLEITMGNDGINVKTNKEFTGALKKYSNTEFTIPANSELLKNADINKITAKMNNGVLLILLPIKEEFAKNITIL